MEHIKHIVHTAFTDYTRITIITIISIVVLIVCYYISEPYRTGTVLTNMDIYRNILQLENLFIENSEYTISDYYIASSFRSIIGNNQIGDYCSTEILEHVILSGARLVWFDIFNSDFSTSPVPIVCNGKEEGNWNYSLNSVDFDRCCKTIADLAFNKRILQNYNDPFFICLNLKTKNNLYTLNKIYTSILDHLSTRLMGIEYGYNKVNFGGVRMSSIIGTKTRPAKIIIFSSTGYQNSKLEELINYSWENTSMKKIVHYSIDPNTIETEYVKENTENITNHNSTNLSIIVPDETTFFTHNYNFNHARKIGSQFISMHYQKSDKHMLDYIDFFKRSSIVLKPENLRKTALRSYEPLENTVNRKDTTVDPPSVPPPDTSTPDQGTETLNPIELKHMCFMGTTGCKEPNWHSIKTDQNLLQFAIDKPLFDTDAKAISGFDTDSNKNIIYALINSENGLKMKHTKIDLCCSNRQYIEIKNKYYLSPSCGVDKVSLLALKIHQTDESNIKKYYVKVSDEPNSEYIWIHTNLCLAKNLDSLNKNYFCLLSKEKCINEYNQFKTENDYYLCCKK